MISIHIGDFVTDLIFASVAIWLITESISTIIKIRIFWLERKLIREQKKATGGTE